MEARCRRRRPCLRRLPRSLRHLRLPQPAGNGGLHRPHPHQGKSGQLPEPAGGSARSLPTLVPQHHHHLLGGGHRPGISLPARGIRLLPLPFHRTSRRSAGPAPDHDVPGDPVHDRHLHDDLRHRPGHPLPWSEHARRLQPGAHGWGPGSGVAHQGNLRHHPP